MHQLQLPPAAAVRSGLVLLWNGKEATACLSVWLPCSTTPRGATCGVCSPGKVQAGGRSRLRRWRSPPAMSLGWTQGAGDRHVSSETGGLLRWLSSVQCVSCRVPAPLNDPAGRNGGGSRSALRLPHHREEPQTVSASARHHRPPWRESTAARAVATAATRGARDPDEQASRHIPFRDLFPSPWAAWGREGGP